MTVIVEGEDYRKVCPKCGDWIWPITTIPNIGTLYYIHVCSIGCGNKCELSESDKEALQ